MKTADRAAYRMLTPGTYYWTLPSGTYLVDPTGTYQLTRPTSSYPAPNPATTDPTAGLSACPGLGFEARCARTSTSGDSREPQANRNHPSSSSRPQFREHPKPPRADAGPG